jgi:hypothetical protein
VWCVRASCSCVNNWGPTSSYTAARASSPALAAFHLRDWDPCPCFVFSPSPSTYTSGAEEARQSIRTRRLRHRNSFAVGTAVGSLFSHQYQQNGMQATKTAPTPSRCMSLHRLFSSKHSLRPRRYVTMEKGNRKGKENTETSHEHLVTRPIPRFQGAQFQYRMIVVSRIANYCLLILPLAGTPMDRASNRFRIFGDTQNGTPVYCNYS